MKRAPLLIAGGLFLAGIGTAAILLWPADKATHAALRPDDALLVAHGQKIYATQCAACHGANLEGEPNWRDRKPDGLLPAPPHDETGHTWHHPDAVLFELTKYGLPKEIGGQPYRSAMPAYDGRLSDDEIIAVLSFIKSTWAPDKQARHDGLNAAAAAAR